MAFQLRSNVAIICKINNHQALPTGRQFASFLLLLLLFFLLFYLAICQSRNNLYYSLATKRILNWSGTAIRTCHNRMRIVMAMWQLCIWGPLRHAAICLVCLRYYNAAKLRKPTSCRSGGSLKLIATTPTWAAFVTIFHCRTVNATATVWLPMRPFNNLLPLLLPPPLLPFLCRSTLPCRRIPSWSLPTIVAGLSNFYAASLPTCSSACISWQCTQQQWQQQH